MEFKCSGCDYVSDTRKNIKRHFITKNCGGHAPHVIEIPIVIKCEHCKKRYTTKPSLKRHLKNCKILQTIQRENEIKKQLIEQNNTVNITTNYNNNNINNNINIQVNSYDRTDFSVLTDRHFYAALNRYLMSVPQLIEFTHFNKKRPQNHNIYISSHKGKYAYVFNGNNWEVRDKVETVESLINNHEHKLERWVEENAEKDPRIVDKFKEYLRIKEKKGAEEAMKEEVRMMLYNKRNLVLNKNPFH